MKKILLFVAVNFMITSFVFSQQKAQKIVFDFTKNDTANFSTMIRHATNIMALTGNAQLEIVCHGPGLDMLMKEKSTVQKEIGELQSKYNIVFAACEATMKRRGVDKSQLVPNIITVPAALLEISAKQQEGWSYVKEGY
jgi:intracellular sulfur oxidation DsrE/DsrF family protein